MQTMSHYLKGYDADKALDQRRERRLAEREARRQAMRSEVARHQNTKGA